MIEAAESDHKTNRNRQLHQKINVMRKGYKRHAKCIMNKDGKLIIIKIKIAERWAKYFKQLGTQRRRP